MPQLHEFLEFLLFFERCLLAAKARQDALQPICKVAEHVVQGMPESTRVFLLASSLSQQVRVRSNTTDTARRKWQT